MGGHVRYLLRGAGLGLLLATVLSPVAWAQDSKSTTVGGRTRPSSDSLGVQISSFTLYPSLTLGTEYNDNIFATDGDEVDDVIFTVTPEMVLQSDWANHALAFQASATIFRYADNPDEDVEDYSIATNGRIDVLRSTAINGGFGFSKSHEDRGSPDDVDGKEPTEFYTLGGQAGISHRISRLWGEFSQEVRHLNYDDTLAQGGGSINNDDRDRMEYDTKLRVGYDLHPDASAFIQAGFNIEDYDNTPDDQGFDRDSYAYGIDVGASFDITGVIFGEVFAGIQQEFYDDSEFSNSKLRPSFGAGLDWNVTKLTTVTFDSASTFEETTVDAASNVWAWDSGIGVNHELLRTVVLNGGAGYRREDYLGISRVDDVIDFEFGATYLMNRYVHISGGYSYRQRFSDAADEDYTENIIGINLRFQY
jgi:hypothetical protein